MQAHVHLPHSIATPTPFLSYFHRHNSSVVQFLSAHALTLSRVAPPPPPTTPFPQKGSGPVPRPPSPLLWHQQVHSCYCVPIVILPHVKGLDIPGIVSHCERRLVKYNFTQIPAADTAAGMTEQDNFNVSQTHPLSGKRRLLLHPDSKGGAGMEKTYKNIQKRSTCYHKINGKGLPFCRRDVPWHERRPDATKSVLTSACQEIF